MLEALLSKVQIQHTESFDELLQKVQRLIYITVEIITETWKESEGLDTPEKQAMCAQFEIAFVCMKSKFTSMASFSELK